MTSYCEIVMTIVVKIMNRMHTLNSRVHLPAMLTQNCDSRSVSLWKKMYQWFRAPHQSDLKTDPPLLSILHLATHPHTVTHGSCIANHRLHKTWPHARGQKLYGRDCSEFSTDQKFKHVPTLRILKRSIILPVYW